MRKRPTTKVMAATGGNVLAGALSILLVGGLNRAGVQFTDIEQTALQALLQGAATFASGWMVTERDPVIYPNP